MSWLSRFFGRPEKKNTLVVLEESNAELRQLLFLEKKHSADLLQQLSKALSNTQGNHSETLTKEPGRATPKEQEVLDLFEKQEKITSHDVCKALGYKCRQIGSERITKMLRKGLLKKIGSGKLSAYVLPV